MASTERGIRQVDIDREMQQSYLDYAMSVIISRALPDARDGLKPGSDSQAASFASPMALLSLEQVRSRSSFHRPFTSGG